MSTNKVTILFYFTEDEVTDSCQEIIKMAESLLAQGAQAKFLVSNKSSSLAAFMQNRNLEVDFLKVPAFLLWESKIQYPAFKKIQLFFTDLILGYQYARKLVRFAGMFNFDLIHTHGVTAHLMSIALRVRFHTKLLWQAWNLPRTNYGAILFLGSIFSDRVVFRSDDYEKILLQKLEEIGFQTLKKAA